MLADPLIEDPAQIAFDGNGRMFVVELRGYFQTPEGIDLIPPIGRISMHEDRDNDGFFEHHSVFVDKLVFPRFVLPFGANTILTMETNADEVWKYTRHEWRRCRRQEGVVRHELRARGQHGVSAGEPVLGDGQLALQHSQRLQAAVDAERASERANGSEQLAVGGDAGQRRQGLVPERRQRIARVLPVPHSLRKLRVAGSVRTRPEHRVGRAHPHRRHPGGATRHAHAGRIADLRHRRGRKRDLSWRSSAEGSRLATTCTAKSWPVSCDGSGRSRPKGSRSFGTSIPAPSSFARWIRCSGRSTSRPVRTARSTSPTCIAA